MTEPTDPSAPHERQIAAVYAEHYRLLHYIATCRFRVPPDDVCPLIHDVFVSFLRNRHRIRNARAWLVGAMYKACTEYRAAHTASGVTSGGEPVTLDHTAERLDLVAVLAQLPARCREVLQRRFLEGYSTNELARWLATTTNNAKQIVHRCKAHARALFTRAGGRS